MIKIYRKTATIKAERFDGSAEMIDKYDIINTQLASTTIGFEGAYFLPILEGELRVNIGDWIATGVEDENWAIADDVFKQTYAELPVIPEEVSLSIEDWKKHHLGIDQIFGMVYQYEITRTQGSPVINWIMCGNQDAFARDWLDEYVVEEDK